MFDYDPCSQALAKIERGFETDLSDVAAMHAEELVGPVVLRELFAAIDAEVIRGKLERALE